MIPWQTDHLNLLANENRCLEFHQAIKKIPASLDAQQIDLTKLTYAGFKIVETQFGEFGGTIKSVSIAIGIYLNYGQKQFLCVLASIYEMNGQLKLAPGSNFKQVARIQTQLA